MTSSNPNHLPKIPSPNVTTLGIRVSTSELFRDTNIQSPQNAHALSPALYLDTLHVLFLYFSSRYRPILGIATGESHPVL